MDSLNIEEVLLDELSMQIYGDLRSIGKLPVSTLARRTGTKRTTMYYLLERLGECGMITYTKSNGMRLFAAEDPKRISSLVHKRIESIGKCGHDFLERFTS